MNAPANLPVMSGFGGGRGRAWLLTSSVLLHGAVLATLAGFQLWQVQAVAEPPLADVYMVQLPLPPLPESPRAAQPEHPPQRADKPPQQAPAQPAAKRVVQPELASIPQKVPGAALVPLPADPPATPPGTGDRPGRDPNGDGTGDGRGTKACAGCSGFGDDRVLPVGGPIGRPQVVTRVQPRYTEAARAAHLQGVAVLRAVIDEDGNVIDVRIVQDLPFGLGQEAVKAVNQWKYTPVLLDGMAVKVSFKLTVVFELR